jgi:hypothetical protein
MIEKNTSGDAEEDGDEGDGIGRDGSVTKEIGKEKADRPIEDTV